MVSASGDVDLPTMMVEVGPLAVREALRPPRHRRFGKAQSFPGVLAEPEPTKVALVEAWRHSHLAAVLEGDETSVEEEIRIGCQQEPIGAVEPFVGRFARSPGLNVAGDQKGRVGNSGEPASVLHLLHV